MLKVNVKIKSTNDSGGDYSSKYSDHRLNMKPCHILGMINAQPYTPVVQLTLHKCVKCSRGWKVGCDNDVLFAGAFGLYPHSTIRVGAVAAHPACRVGHIRQPPVTVIPVEGQRAPEEEKFRHIGKGWRSENCCWKARKKKQKTTATLEQFSTSSLKSFLWLTYVTSYKQ